MMKTNRPNNKFLNSGMRTAAKGEED